MKEEKKAVLENSEKKKIYYSRDYRHLSRIGIVYVLQLLFILIPIVLIYLCSYTKISYYVSKFSGDMIASITGQKVTQFKEFYLPVFGGVYCNNMHGRAPSFTESFISVVLTLILIIICSRVKTNRKPLMMFMTIGLYIHLVASVYFVFFSKKFPYNMKAYSTLYMKQQIIIWLMIIIIYWICSSLIVHMALERILSFIVLIILSFIYGVVRYILYMIIISQMSYLFMASLYFTFGVLFDFLLLVGVFAIFESYASIRFKSKEKGGLWQWS